MRDILDKSIIVISLICGALLINSKHRFVCAVLSWIDAVLVIVGILRAKQLHPLQFWRTGGTYVLILALGTVFIVGRSNDKDVPGFELPVGVSLLLFGTISAILLFIFPLPSPPSLVGRHKYVGTYSFDFPIDHDSNRDKSFGDVDKENKFMTIQCWFPMDTGKMNLFDRIKLFCKSRALLWTSGNPATEWHELKSLMKTVATSNKLPSILTEHLSLARTHSIYQADLSQILVSEKPMPVAIYSHGMYGWRQISSQLCESLASCGYIVFAADQSPDSMLHRPAQNNSDKTFDFHVPDKENDRVYYSTGLRRRLFELDYFVHYLLNVQYSHPPAERRYYSYSYSMYVKWNSLFRVLEGKIDVTKQLCLWGHSFGGGTVTAYACLHRSKEFVDMPTSSTPLHPQVCSIVPLDSWMYPVPDDIRKRGLQCGVSILNLSAERWSFGKYQAPFRSDVIKRSKDLKVGLDMIIRGTDHQNYCESHLLVRHFFMKCPEILGDLDPLLVSRAIERTICSFFTASVSHDTYGERNESITAAGPLVKQSQDEIITIDVSDSEDRSDKRIADATLVKSSKTPIALHANVESLIQYCMQLKGDYDQFLSNDTKDFITKHVVHESEVENFADYSFFDTLSN